jgi:pimeloyl-ACP methyl ester carboxylesterase
MSNQTPIVVLVHGAFAESSTWYPVIESLGARDIESVAVANPLRSLAGDAAYVRDVVTGLGRPVLLVGHSYGGMVITEAASENPAVVGLVYVAAFAPEQGESALQLSTTYPGSTLGEALTEYPVSAGGKEVVIRQDVFHQQFAADLPASTAALMAATQRPVTEAALAEGLPTDRPAWRSLPSWFVFGEDDRNIPAAAMRHAASRAGARSVTQLHGASHAVSLAHPTVVVDTILEALDDRSAARAA